MIQPIKQNVNFIGAHQGMYKVPEVYDSVTEGKYYPAPYPEAAGATVQEIKPKKSFGEKLHDIKLGFMNFIKGFNNVKNTGSGFVKGLVDGACGAALIGTLGKNIVSGERDIFKTLGGTISDVAGFAVKVVKHIPDLLTKAPLENIKTASTLPTRFVKYMKSPAVVAAASAVGLGLVAFRTVQGKINANKANANLDHAINEGHLPTK